MLHLAVLSGDIPTIQLVDSLINLQDKDGITALHVAIIRQPEREDIVKTLLFFYPDLTIQNHQGDTPLHTAAKLHLWNLFLLLCKHAVQVEIEKNHPPGSLLKEAERDGDSWLVMAYRDRHVEALQWLLEHGVGDWKDVDSQVTTMLIFLYCKYYL